MLFLAGFLFILLATLQCTNTIRNVTSAYQEQAVKVDASLEEWGDRLTFDPKSKLFYGVRHDTENLYLALRTRDPVVQRKIMAFGLTVWIDTSAQRVKDLGIRYPVPKKENLPPPEAQSDKDLPLRARRAKPQFSNRFLRTTDRQHLLLLNFDGKERSMMDVDESREIRVGVEAESKNGVSYELAVPMDKLFDGPPGGSETLSFGFVTGSLDESDDSGSSFGGGGMAPFGGSGGGRSMGGGQSSGLEKFSKSTELWLKGVTIRLSRQ